MKTYLISDNRDTHLGMRLAGITGVIVHSKEEILKELDKAINNREIGIIIVTEEIMDKAKDEIMELKLKRSFPLITTIPDRHSSLYDRDFITKYIKESVGIKI